MINQRGDITTDTTEIQRAMKEHPSQSQVSGRQGGLLVLRSGQLWNVG
jgi:hypothetical protein